MANITIIDFPECQTFKTILGYLDSASPINTSQLFKCTYIIFKALLKEVKRNKQPLMKFLHEIFYFKINVFKACLKDGIEKIGEFGQFIENNQDISQIDNITMIYNENIMKYSLKILNLGMQLTTTKNSYDVSVFLSQMSILQKFGKNSF